MGDTELIKKAQQGDRSAFESLLREHYDAMFRMAFKWCGNRQDAEDITQEACIKLARNIGSFRFESAFSSWLFRLVINVGKDMARSRKSDHSDGPDQAMVVAAGAEERRYAQQVMAHIHGLPENEKSALILVFGEGLRHKDAAVIMGCKESTVSWYIHEARKKLVALGSLEKAWRHG